MDKYIDLNGRKSNAALIKLRDKEFRIVRIVAGVRVGYSNYLKTISNLFNDIAKATDSDNKDEEEKLLKKYEKIAEEVPETLLGIIKLLLTTNDLEFNDAWWREEVDINDMRYFIDAALSKDFQGTIKKKLTR